jgi:hypothetical protein
MNKYLISGRPTIYADMNVYRYVAYGDISIENPERFMWVYSHVHLNEIVRNGNTDALDGMKALGAVEIRDVLNERFESVGKIVLMNYVDPHERYKQHFETIMGLKDQSDFMVEILLRSFGADNFDDLSLTPERLREEVDRLTREVCDEIRGELLKQAEEVSLEMKKNINTHYKDRRPIDKTRFEMGITSGVRKEAEGSDSPIDEIWKVISPSIKGVTKNQFFGFEIIPGIQGIQYTQHNSFAGAHMALNMLGISPDQGLANKEKIKNIMSDGQHVGMASYCNVLLSADRKFSNKANAIYKYAGSITKSLWFQYQKGLVVKLGIEQRKRDI